MRKLPVSFIALALLGCAAAVPGLASLCGVGGLIHPLLDDPMAGRAFIVSAVALFGSAAFPLVIAGLRRRDGET